MTDSERRRVETFIRIRQFGADNAADFPAGSIGATQFAEIGTVLDEVEQFAADQAAAVGDARQTFATKDTARENLFEEVYDVARTARSMQFQIDGIEDKFRMPRNRSDQNLLAVGRAFYDESLEYNAQFIEYGLPFTFRAELLAAVEAFETSLNPTGTAIDSQVAGTAEIAAAVRRGMTARQILTGVVKNKYRNDVGKLAAWLSASHIEKAPKKSVVPPPKP